MSTSSNFGSMVRVASCQKSKIPFWYTRPHNCKLLPIYMVSNIFKKVRIIILPAPCKKKNLNLLKCWREAYCYSLATVLIIANKPNIALWWSNFILTWSVFQNWPDVSKSNISILLVPYTDRKPSVLWQLLSLTMIPTVLSCVNILSSRDCHVLNPILFLSEAVQVAIERLVIGS